MPELRDAAKLRKALADADCSGARLGRQVNVSTQFVNLLTTGRKRSCSLKVAVAIEEALGLYPGALFVLEVRPQKTDEPSSEGLAS